MLANITINLKKNITNIRQSKHSMKQGFHVKYALVELKSNINTVRIVKQMEFNETYFRANRF